ncbi:MAG: hypothetical protein H7323_01180 [Frankiales bacterium]|nr:hypothetical protein [Frankiales bacterium]
MTVVRGAAARRLVLRTHALHLQPPQLGLRAPAISGTAAGAALPTTDHLAAPGSRAGHEGSGHGPGASGEPWSAVLEVPTAACLHHTRTFVRSQLHEHGPADRTDDATLIAIELVTNALEHTSASIVTLRLSSPPGGVLLLEVTDPDPSCPALSGCSNAQDVTRDTGTAAAAASSGSGRGLDIVGLLSCWGVNEHPGGKTVWALLHQDDGDSSGPVDDHVHAPTPAAAILTAGPAAAPAESRPGHLGAVHWTLACSARHLRIAGGLPPLQREELRELLLPWHGVTDTDRVLDSVTRVTAALCGAGSGGSLRLSASTGHLLAELTGPASTSLLAAPNQSDAARLAGAHSAGRHHTFGEARNRQVHWAAITLPERRPRGITSPAATATAEQGDDWA